MTLSKVFFSSALWFDLILYSSHYHFLIYGNLFDKGPEIMSKRKHNRMITNKGTLSDFIKRQEL